MAFACKLCVAKHGLKGSEIASLPQTKEELVDHIESVHNIAVRRESESEDECLQRFYAKYPDARSPQTCKCPECVAKRK